MKPEELLEKQIFIENKKCSGIYLLFNTRTKKAYIGSAFSIKRRWYSHTAFLNKNKHVNSHLQNAWNLDKNNFQFLILELVEKLLLEERENYYLQNIDKDYLYNICPISKSKKLSEETKEKISKAHKGKKLTKEHIEKMVSTRLKNGTNKHTEESKKKLSEAHKGKLKKKGYKHTEEHRRKIREKVIGVKRSDEMKLKMSKAHIGIKLNAEHAKNLKEALQKSWDERIKNGYLESEKHLETKRKISEKAKGRKMSEEQKKKLSEIKKENQVGTKELNYL